MSDYVEFKLNIESNESISFYFTFNEKTNFKELLEYILYNFPEKDLCPCFKFQFKNDKCNQANSKYIDIDINSKIKEFIRDKNYKFKPVNLYLNKNKNSMCSSSVKNYYKKLKTEIIEELNNNNSFESDKFKNILTNLEKENNELKQKTMNSEKGKNTSELENENLKNEIKELKKNKQLYENKEKEFEKLIAQYKDEINKLSKEKHILEIAINGDITKINQLKELGVTGDFLKPKENTIKVDQETNKIYSKSKLNKDTDFLDFYDVIINIKSIKDIIEGWEIKMSKRAEENYETFKNDKIIKIGVIGNSNKGKSFLLSKISKINLPSGTSITTEGLSIKYPELDLYKNRRIALIDSAGLETPVLKEQQKEKITTNENTNDCPIELETPEIEEKKVENTFKEKSREKLITEVFLQNYIINTSNILIIVVGILTYSEQKLLNRIKTEIQKSKINKQLFIIHNLITYTSIEQVKEYINNVLLKSETFFLEEGHYTSTKLEIKKGIYFYEKETNPTIYHLIFANEGSESGEYYNNFTLDFIENQYLNVTDLKTFDVIETIKDKFLETSKEIFEKLENPLTKNDLDNSDNKIIKLKNIKELKLKKCLIDELGFSNLRTNGFEPTYNYYKKDNKLIVKVEAPGKSSIKTQIKHEQEYTFIRLIGIKKKDKEPEKIEDNIFNSREIGNFLLNIPLKTDEYLIKNEKPKIEQIKGIFVIEFQLDVMNTEAEFNEDDDADI